MLLVHALPHPDARVRQVGFPLDHPYVEQCWAGAIGPSATLLLRRLPELWSEAMPAELDIADFARSLGLGRSTGGWQSRIWRTFERLRQFGLATPVEGDAVGVYAQVRPVSERFLHRSPAWTQFAHDRLITAHLDQLAGEPRATLAGQVVARLDHLQHSGPTTPAPGRSA